MSQRDGFSGGFILGTLVGGVVGGVVGALLASRQLPPTDPSQEQSRNNLLDAKSNKKRRLFNAGKATTDADIESARRSLEDKIAQLNDAIDDARQQLGGVNAALGEEPNEQPRQRDPHRST